MHANAGGHHQHIGTAPIMQKACWEKRFYIRDDDDEVHACQFFHQIGYDGKTCMHAGRRHHHQKYLTTPSEMVGVNALYFIQYFKIQKQREETYLL